MEIAIAIALLVLSVALTALVVMQSGKDMFLRIEVATISEQKKAATGVRGLIGSTFVGLPLMAIYCLILFVGPITQGCFNYGCSVILGGPLIFMFNTLGMDVTVVCAALSLIFPMGDCLPPSRIVGRLACEETGCDSYMGFLKTALVPMLILGIMAVIMIIKPAAFAFMY